MEGVESGTSKKQGKARDVREPEINHNNKNERERLNVVIVPLTHLSWKSLLYTESL